MTQLDSMACWAVAASCALHTFFGMMLVKSESVMYVGFMDMLHANREDASWSPTLSVTMSQLAGLGAACEGVVPYTVTARHFVRYRGVAMGILFTSTALSGFVFPLVAEALRQAFEFPTVLFILGALQLSMLLCCIVVDRVPPGGGEACGDAESSIADSGSSEVAAVPPPVQRGQANSFLTASLAQTCVRTYAESLSLPKSFPGFQQPPDESYSLLSEEESRWSRLARGLRSLVSLDLSHLATSRAVSLFTFSVFVLVAVDFGADNGFAGYQAVAMVTACAVGDLVARIGTGLLLDFDLLKGDTLMLWCFAIQAASAVVLALVKQYWLLVAGYFFVGMSAGSAIMSSTIMAADLCDQETLPLSLGAIHFFSGVVCFARPPIIGYARDTIGSYDLLFAAFAIAYAAVTLTWAVRVCWHRCRSRRRDKILELN
ncbi:hypothetical protein HPB48_003170 [Haemaphysalis longicornis]|uniref:Monocarboxylate transporter n=1 Tax=Haemaphysalis longicornis TaxID=44386 RepID=A0A9J6H2E9_HAELO|nr:hypothetical protein HPB48_003170 [Haemaphysalis longicornis]